MRSILDRPAVLILALVRIRATGNVVGGGLPGPGKKAEAFKVRPGLRGRAKVDLPALVDDHDLVEEIVDVLRRLVQRDKSARLVQVGLDTEGLGKVQGG